MWKAFLKRFTEFFKVEETKKYESYNLSVVALVALKKWELPEKERIKTYFRKNYGKEIFVNTWKEDIGTFDIDDNQAIITLMPDGIEWSDLEDSCHRAWYFDKAKEMLEGHKAHLVVSINGGYKESLLEKNIQLSRVVAGVIEDGNAIGVYWYNSKMIRNAEEFYTKAVNLDYERLPIELWIDIRFRMNSSFKEDIYTVGMDKLGFTNIEIINNKIDSYILYVFIYQLCENIIRTGKNLEDKEIIQWDRVEFRCDFVQGHYLNEKVLRLNFN